MLIFLSIFLIFPNISKQEQDNKVFVSDGETKLSEFTSFCGSGSISKRITFFLVDLFTNLQDDLSHCCAIHDDCYDAQRGKMKCDKDFEKCTSKLDDLFSTITYAAVREHGAAAYRAAANDDPQLIFQTRDTSISKQFDNLYNFCKKSKANISSCIIRHEHCKNRKKEKRQTCRVWLASCLLYTYGHREINEKCDDKIEKFIEKDLKIKIDDVPFLPE
ncbi:unnamed protein product [Caenorhabditis angaria]|uniref:Phospholipase A(2) n=1 Tax=Caenorhabditis angaria TaxID=860376 RepID=A0A9P1IPY6_9PELO|nr:unnamed protein product [Caenorhabditis angaria]